MRRRPKGIRAAFLTGSLIVLACGDPGPPPDIVLIVVDDLRWDALGVTGSPVFESPSIDRIAREGARFDLAFVTAAVCSPSRATLLTGLYPHEHGVKTIRDELDPALPTAAGLLQAAGYETAFVGKWHLSQTGTPHPGFDHWVSLVGQGRYIDPVLNVDGAWQRGSGHVTDLLSSHALRLLALDRDRPFFLMLSYKAVHEPFVPPDRFRGRYATTEIPRPPTLTPEPVDKPLFLTRCRGGKPAWEFRQARARRYLECLAGVEESVARILKLLETRGTLDRTLVLLTSDNGYLFGEHRIGGKRTAYEPSIRVPLLVRYPPRFPAGTTVQDQIALNLDVAPTLLDAAGIQPPQAMRGIPLWSLASGQPGRDAFVYGYDHDPLGARLVRCVPTIRAIRTREHKYVTYPGTKETEELYDLEADPHEATNLADAEEYRAMRDALRSRLAELRRGIGDP